MDSRTPLATLEGNSRQPEVCLWFDRDARHAASGISLVEWVKKAPRRHWDRERGCWVITAFGGTLDSPRDPDAVLAKAGFRLVLNPPADPSLANVVSLSELMPPLARSFPDRPAVALVRPRLGGFDLAREILGAGAIWDKSTGRFEVPLTDLLVGGEPKPMLDIDAATLAAARELIMRKPTFGHAEHSDDTIRAATRALAAATGIDVTVDEQAEIDRIVDVVGDVPDWFGLDLYAYQRLGALAAAAGVGFIADPQGLGKTRTALATLAIRGTDRAVAVVPPVGYTHWLRETAESGLASADGREVIGIRAGRKEPELPDAGIVVVPDSLLASRPELRARIAAWRPDALVYDEVHRARTWRSQRAQAVRDLADRLPADAIRLVATGTPLLSNPAELASPLAISGHLGPVFGGYDAFVERYTTRNHFNAPVARVSRLPELRRILAERVWVRRQKDEVLPDLPPLSRHGRYVDVDLSGFRAAHNEIIDKITEWVEEWLAQHDGEYPSATAVDVYAQGRIGLISPLRRAAGLAKVPAALDALSEWIESEVQINADGTFTCARPLILWVHHAEVIEAICESVKGKQAKLVRTITGATSVEERGRIADEFQAGKIPVLVASIMAANTAITLTYGCDAWFLESDWTPAEIEQAEDRLNRIGQTRPITITTWLAEGTLDARIQRVLAKKGRITQAMLGSGDVAILTEAEANQQASPTEIVAELAAFAVARHRKRSGRAAA
ncbi:MAG: DEAD/DEAH box helicase [Nocardioides sp.]